MSEIKSSITTAQGYATNISNNAILNTNSAPPQKGITNLAVNDNNSKAYSCALRGANELRSCIESLSNGINSIAASFEKADKEIAGGLKK